MANPSKEYTNSSYNHHLDTRSNTNIVLLQSASSGCSLAGNSKLKGFTSCGSRGKSAGRRNGFTQGIGSLKSGWDILQWHSALPPNGCHKYTALDGGCISMIIVSGLVTLSVPMLQIQTSFGLLTWRVSPCFLVWSRNTGGNKDREA